MLRSTLSSLAIMISAIAFGVLLGFLFHPLTVDKPKVVNHDIGSTPVRSSSHTKTTQKFIERAKLIDRIKRASIETKPLQNDYALPPRSDLYIPPEKETPATGFSTTFSKPLTELVGFQSSPFPYTGTLPNSTTPFLNYKKEGRQAHKTRSGRVYWQEETYNDNRVLLHIPQGFDNTQPGVIVLFFHGHGATLEKDVLTRQQVPEQISMAGVNAVLVAPQFAVNARDSSAGKFWKPGGARRFLKETSRKLAKLYGSEEAAKDFDNMPVVIVGYSGGYSPAAWCLANGGIASRVKGVILLDALYSHLGTFANWIAKHRSAIFLSAYTHHGQMHKRNQKLQEMLKARKIPYQTRIQGVFQPGTVVFLEAEQKHRHFVTRAWVNYPVRDALLRLTGTVPGIDRIHSASF